MHISHVALDDFRSYSHLVLEIPEGITVFTGKNGQGKTNIVEAIAFMSTFSSHRISAEQALVRIPQKNESPIAGAVIRVKLVTRSRASSHDLHEMVLELEIVRGRANRARINRTVVSPKDIIGRVRTVLFAPEDIYLIRGEPQVRRNFLDEIAIQLRPTLAVTRSDFERVNRQRAALLKQASMRVRRGYAPDLSTLDTWNDQFAHLSAELTFARSNVVKLLSNSSDSAYKKISGSQQKFRVIFDPSQKRYADSINNSDFSFNELKENMYFALREVRDREIERGVNLVGAHRDDLKLMLDEMLIKGYASHGETWSAALALRLGAFSILSKEGDTPILILDDVFAELDSARRNSLAEFVTTADQVLITAAVPEDLPPSLLGKQFRVHRDSEFGSQVSSEETDQ